MDNATGVYSGILKWSMEYVDGTQESPTREMSAEDRAFLSEALENMVVDEISELKKVVAVLKTPEPTNEEELQQKLQMLDMLLDYVDQIDAAVNFHLLGGFVPLIGTLNSRYPALQSAAAEAFAYIVQNNPKCQDWALENGALRHLLQNFDIAELQGGDEQKQPEVAPAAVEPEDPAKTKVLEKSFLGISALVRSHEMARNVFMGVGGILVLKHCLQHSSARLQRKSIFLLRSLMTSDSRIKGTAAEVGILPLLAASYASGQEDVDIREFALGAMLEACSDFPQNIPLLAACSEQLLAVMQEREAVVAALPEDEQCDWVEEVKSIQKLRQLLQ